MTTNIFVGPEDYFRDSDGIVFSMIIVFKKDRTNTWDWWFINQLYNLGYLPL